MPSLDEFIEKQSSQRSDWFQPSEMETSIRFLSDKYAVYPTHYIPTKKQSVICVGEDKGCSYLVEKEVPKRDEGGHPILEVDGKTPIMEKKMVHSPSIKYLFWVIDRTDGKIKIGKFPYSIVKQFAALKTSEEYKFTTVPNFDVSVKKSKTGPRDVDVEYSLIPSRFDKELTEEEKAGVSKLDNLEDIVEKMKEKQLVKNATTENEEGGE